VWRTPSPSCTAGITQAILLVLPYDHRLSIVDNPHPIPVAACECSIVGHSLSRSVFWNILIVASTIIPSPQLPSHITSFKRHIWPSGTLLFSRLVGSVPWIRQVVSTLFHVDILNRPLALAKLFTFMRYSPESPGLALAYCLPKVKSGPFRYVKRIKMYSYNFIIKIHSINQNWQYARQYLHTKRDRNQCKNTDNHLTKDPGNKQGLNKYRIIKRRINVII
jgi:hypothetical protein